VQLGTTVNWVNQDQTSHTTTADNGAWSGNVPGNDSYGRVFNTRGSFSYKCTIHPTMEGTINVQ
jgi:plastocyanin